MFNVKHHHVPSAHEGHAAQVVESFEGLEDLKVTLEQAREIAADIKRQQVGIARTHRERDL